jgi:hypothetical protein
MIRVDIELGMRADERLRTALGVLSRGHVYDPISQREAITQAQSRKYSTLQRWLMLEIPSRDLKSGMYHRGRKAAATDRLRIVNKISEVEMNTHAVKRPLSRSRPCSITRSERKQLLDSHLSFPFTIRRRSSTGIMRSMYCISIIRHGFSSNPLPSHHIPSTPQLPRPLKIPTAPHDSNTLIHNRLTNPKVAVDPLADTGRLGEGV